jgi:hypothetical protein
MPKPRKNETRKQFISRCIPYVHKERPSWENDHIIAYCFGVWKEHLKKGSLNFSELKEIVLAALNAK